MKFQLCVFWDFRVQQYNQMQGRREHRLNRRKIPNLCQPGLKFNCAIGEGPTFFSKISNTFKLLEQPPLAKNKNAHNLTHTGFRLFKKATISMRIKQLAKPKQRSMSLPQRFSPSKQEKRQRYSFSKIEGKSKNNEDQIVGTALAVLPLQKILAHRQEYMQVKQKTITIESEDEEEHMNESKQSRVEDLTPVKEDFVKWLQKIVGNQGNLYEQYERGLLDKVSIYERKRLKQKSNYDGSWK